MQRQPNLISVIIPVYNEEAVLAESYKRFKEVMDGIGVNYELIYVDDGSRDNTLASLRALAQVDESVAYISFSRNFGHQKAVSAGMDACKGDAVVIIDADLQDPPEVIVPMLDAWRDGVEVAYGQRLQRQGETLFKRITAFFYYRVLKSMSGVPIPLDTGDFRLIDRRVCDALIAMREQHRFLRGMAAWAGFSQRAIPYQRAPRFAGSTKYTLAKMLRLAGDGIMGFSSRPLHIATCLGICVSALGFLGLLALVILACARVRFESWLWGAAGVLAVQGLTLVAIGIQGAYIARVYDEVRGRPLYIIAESNLPSHRNQ